MSNSFSVPRRAIVPRHRHELKAFALLQESLRIHVNPTRRIEEFFQELLGVDHALFLPSGRGALYWALRAADEPVVYVPAYTCYAVVEAALLAGKKVVYVDVDENTYNVSESAVRKILRPQGILLATHQFGLPCAIEGLVKAAHQSDCRVIEDCAGGLGGTIDGRPLGSYGDLAVFSFEHTKTASAWNAGLLAGKDRAWFERTRTLWTENGNLSHGGFLEPFVILGYALATWPPIYGRVVLPEFLRRKGMTAGVPVAASQLVFETYLRKVSSLQARLVHRGLANLPYIRMQRHRIVRTYQDHLGDCEGLSLYDARQDAEALPIRFPLRIQSVEKSAFYRAMLDECVDIGFSFNYSCVPTEMANLYPGAATLARETVNLPLYSRVEPLARRIAEAVRRALSGTGG